MNDGNSIIYSVYFYQFKLSRDFRVGTEFWKEKLNPGLPWHKLHLTRRRIFFYQQIGLKFEEETSEVLRLEHSSVWC